MASQHAVPSPNISNPSMTSASRKIFILVSSSSYRERPQLYVLASIAATLSCSVVLGSFHHGLSSLHQPLSTNSHLLSELARPQRALRSLRSPRLQREQTLWRSDTKRPIVVYLCLRACAYPVRHVATSMPLSSSHASIDITNRGHYYMCYYIMGVFSAQWQNSSIIVSWPSALFSLCDSQVIFSRPPSL